MRKTSNDETAVLVALFAAAVIFFSCLLGLGVAWLLLVVWNFFATSVGVPGVLPITMKSVLALWCLLVVFRFVFRRRGKDKK